MSASSKKKIRREQEASMLTERQQKELSEARKVKTLTVVFSAIMILIVVSFLAIQIVAGIDRNGIFEKNTVVATVGEHKLNTVTMNYYFYDAVANTYNNANSSYGDYASSFFLSQGLDLSKPLNSQICDEETGETWADHFLEQAIQNAKSDYALYDLAKAEGFTLPEDSQSQIDMTLSYLQLYASMSGTDTSNYLRAMYGSGSNEKSYREYLTVSQTASAYYSAHMDSLSYTDADYREAEAENYSQYSAFTYNYYTLNYTSFLQGGTEGEDGKKVYTDEENDAARKAAEAASMTLGSATTLEELDAAIAGLEINADLETKPTSTERANAKYTSLNEEYAKWLSEDGRKEGDVKVFPNTVTSTDEDGNETKVTNSYSVVMFRSRNDNLEKLDNVRHILITPEGGTKDDNGNTTYSDEEMAAAKAEAEALLKQWQEGEATEDSFIALAKEKSDDTGSKDSGGLIEDIHRDSSLVENFRAWAIDSSRKVGDTGIVESSYGYHIMYYVGEDELSYRDYMIKNDLITEDMESWYESVLEPVTVIEGDDSRINKDLIYSAS